MLRAGGDWAGEVLCCTAFSGACGGDLGWVKTALASSFREGKDTLELLSYNCVVS